MYICNDSRETLGYTGKTWKHILQVTANTRKYPKQVANHLKQYYWLGHFNMQLMSSRMSVE